MAVERWSWDDDPAILEAMLDRGGVLAIPTESSYGLGVRPADRKGVEAIVHIKGRRSLQPLPVVLADPQQAGLLGIPLDTAGLRGIVPHWPAAVTVVVDLAAPMAAGLGGLTLAVRVPAHERLRGLLRRLGTPLTATSANRTGEPALTDPDRVLALLAGTEAVLVDDGLLDGGAPSTLVRWDAGTGGFVVLREGAYPAHLLRRTVVQQNEPGPR